MCAFMNLSKGKRTGHSSKCNKKGLSKGGQKGWSNCWLLYGRMLFVSWDPSSTIRKFSVKPKPQCFPKHNQKWTIVLSDLKKTVVGPVMSSMSSLYYLITFTKEVLFSSMSNCWLVSGCVFTLFKIYLNISPPNCLCQSLIFFFKWKLKKNVHSLACSINFLSLRGVWMWCVMHLAVGRGRCRYSLCLARRQ